MGRFWWPGDHISAALYMKCITKVSHYLNQWWLIIPPHNEVVGGYIGFTPSACPSVCPASCVSSVAPTDTAKLTGPRTLADKKWVGPVKLLCIIMFDISKIRSKFLFGPVKAQKFSWCLHLQFWLDSFHVYTMSSYQATSEGVSRVKFLAKF